MVGLNLRPPLNGDLVLGSIPCPNCFPHVGETYARSLLTRLEKTP